MHERKENWRRESFVSLAWQKFHSSKSNPTKLEDRYYSTRFLRISFLPPILSRFQKKIISFNIGGERWKEFMEENKDGYALAYFMNQFHYSNFWSWEETHKDDFWETVVLNVCTSTQCLFIKVWHKSNVMLSKLFLVYFCMISTKPRKMAFKE